MLLFVEDDDLVGTMLVSWLRSRGHEVEWVRSVADAEARASRETGFRYFILDVHLPEGPHAGVDLLKKLRMRYPDVPAAILTGGLTPELANVAMMLHARPIAKTLGQLEALDAFLRESPPDVIQTSAEVLEEAATRFGLSEAQRKVFSLAAVGQDRDAIKAAMNIRDGTLRAHITSILRKARRGKTEAASLAELVIRILSEALNRQDHGEVGEVESEGPATEPEEEKPVAAFNPPSERRL